MHMNKKVFRCSNITPVIRTVSNSETSSFGLAVLEYEVWNEGFKYKIWYSNVRLWNEIHSVNYRW